MNRQIYNRLTERLCCSIKSLSESIVYFILSLIFTNVFVFLAMPYLVYKIWKPDGKSAH